MLHYATSPVEGNDMNIVFVAPDRAIAEEYRHVLRSVPEGTRRGRGGAASEAVRSPAAREPGSGGFRRARRDGDAPQERRHPDPDRRDPPDQHRHRLGPGRAKKEVRTENPRWPSWPSPNMIANLYDFLPFPEPETCLPRPRSKGTPPASWRRRSGKGRRSSSGGPSRPGSRGSGKCLPSSWGREKVHQARPGGGQADRVRRRLEARRTNELKAMLDYSTRGSSRWTGRGRSRSSTRSRSR